LTGQTRASPAGEDRCPKSACDGDGSDDVVGRPRYDDPNGHLTIVRGIRGIQCTAPGVETYLSLDVRPQLGSKLTFVEMQGKTLAHGLAGGVRLPRAGFVGTQGRAVNLHNTIGHRDTS